MKLEPKFWIALLVPNVVSGVIIWLILSKLKAAKQARTDTVSQVLDAFGQ